MSVANSSTTAGVRNFPNGGGVAAVLAAGIGSFCVAFLALIADKSPAFKNLMIFYKPTGPLSGVTTSSIVLWLAVWAVLHYLWHRRMVAAGRICAVAFALLVMAVLLTFPPIADLF